MANEGRRNPQILIVEDDPEITKLIEILLKMEDGWTLTTVDYGEHAVEAWKKGDFDLILMDLRLPSINGIEAARQIREKERRSGRKHTPIIAFTALVSNDDRQECVDAGFDDFIAKPANLQKVIETMNKYLD